MQMFSSQTKVLKAEDLIGLLIAVIIIGLWFISLFELLTISISNTAWFWLISAILGRTYLCTGLFIIAHDAMHHNLIPNHRSLNHLIGKFAVTVYGFLPYKHCCTNHFNHHRFPSQSGDPDFHGSEANPIFWYYKFLREYLPLRSQIIFLASVISIFLGLIVIFDVSLLNLILFWMLPLVLSSLQLFFFGTYLPHRQVYENPNFSPRLHSDRYSVIWSFFSCYNFGHYHWEHHQYPKTPWYKLHSIHAKGLTTK
jgi:beta-carotene/zeaxanthin 4-ketolase